ncbi:glycine betaine ABC transporter substrate-binding protein [Rhizobium sp. SIMBA_035]|jgi:glycine betaine/proline transport system substrate-binding protein
MPLSIALLLTCGSIVRAAELVIAAPNWPSGKATASILKIGIAKEFGIDAEITEMGALNAFVGLDDGTVDIHPEVWSPNLASVIEKYVVQKKAVVLAHRAVDAWQGLCATPAAAKDFKSVADLKYAAKTVELDTDGDGKGEIWIGAPAWLSTGIERVRAGSYGYAADLSLVEAEEDVAMAAVDAAVATGQPMVFACYAPHYVFDLHKITRLSEPAHDDAKWKIVPASDPTWISKSSAAVAWPTAHFSIAYAAVLKTKHANVAQFLENVDFTTDEVTEMSYALEVERQDPAAFAKTWVEKNSKRVDGWAAK